MADTTYSKINNSIKKIIQDQNIKASDLGCTQSQINNEKIAWFDMAVIKKLEGSNVADKGGVSSNQSSILITGEAQSIFPCIRRNIFAGKAIGKDIIIKSDLRLMNNNYLYLLGDERYKNKDNYVVDSFITTNETTQNRVEFGCKTIDGNDYKKVYNELSKGDLIVILKLASKLEYVILAIKGEDESKYFSDLETNIDVVTFFDKITRVSESNKDKITYVDSSKYSYIRKKGGKNKIYFGAPGTGKSKYVNDKYYNSYSKRITFHPEYTYNDFVGYIRPVAEGDNLTYKFEAGVFTEILTEALRDTNNMYTLIIEELNRANTAAVFGDLFQLLDRNSDGSSEYRVNNTDIYNYIKDTIGSNYEYNDGSIGIPSNLNIIATMNTADQNVFVMDTAFKRRWEFEYIPVKFDNDHEFKDKSISNLNVSWKDFVNTINNFMMSKENEDLMISEDKQIGPYFVKSHELNNSKQFGYKVLLYLWDDVFKMDKYKLFNEEIRTFSGLIEKFSTVDAVNIFKENVVKELTGKLMNVTSQKEENGNE